MLVEVYVESKLCHLPGLSSSNFASTFPDCSKSSWAGTVSPAFNSTQCFNWSTVQYEICQTNLSDSYSKSVVPVLAVRVVICDFHARRLSLKVNRSKNVYLRCTKFPKLFRVERVVTHKCLRSEEKLSILESLIPWPELRDNTSHTGVRHRIF